MNRLTKKYRTAKQEFFDEEPTIVYGYQVICEKKFIEPENYLNNAIDKLGKIEDLMEKYNIDNVEELEKIMKLQKENNNGSDIIFKNIC